MAASNPDHGSEPVSTPTSSSPDELIKDLELTEDKQSSVVGGKGGTKPDEYLILKMSDVIITSVTPS